MFLIPEQNKYAANSTARDNHWMFVMRCANIFISYRFYYAERNDHHDALLFIGIFETYMTEVE